MKHSVQSESTSCHQRLSGQLSSPVGSVLGASRQSLHVDGTRLGGRLPSDLALRAVEAFGQSAHLLLPTTGYWPAGHCACHRMRFSCYVFGTPMQSMPCELARACRVVIITSYCSKLSLATAIQLCLPLTTQASRAWLGTRGGSHDEQNQNCLRLLYAQA